MNSRNPIRFVRLPDGKHAAQFDHDPALVRAVRRVPPSRRWYDPQTNIWIFSRSDSFEIFLADARSLGYPILDESRLTA